MSVYVTSDLHLSTGTDKPMDVFKGWENYQDRIMENWNKRVKRSDTIVIVGDISWALRLEESKGDMDFLNKLPGEKILVKGNHDLWWTTRGKVEKFLEANGFKTIKILFKTAYEVEDIAICGTRGWIYDDNESDKKILIREINRLENSLKQGAKYNTELVVFIHYPPIYNGVICKEIIEVLKRYKVKRCYYGHVHGKEASRKAFIGNYEGINFKFVSCDYNKFTPILVK